MVKRIFSFSVMTAFAVSGAYAAPAAVEHLRTIDFGTTESPSVYRATNVTADAAGMLYFTDNQFDEIGKFDPLLANSGADVELIYDGIGAPFSASSFTGIAVDEFGAVYSAGPGSAYDGVGLLRSVNSGGTWTNTYVVDTSSPGVAAGTTMGGMVYIGNNRLAISDPNSHQIRFYSVNTSTNVLSNVGTNSAASNVTYWSPGLAYDNVNNKLYQASGHAPSAVSGRVDRFSLNLATPTATPDATVNPVVEESASGAVSFSYPLYYQSVAVSPDAKILCVAKNISANGSTDMEVNNSFALYDINSENGSLTPFLNLTGAETPDKIPAFGNIFAYGCTFFKQNNELYLFAMFSSNTPVPPYTNNTRTGYVYKITPYTSGVSDWTVY